MTVQEWLRQTISRLQDRKNRARDSHQKASIGGQICMAHRALNIIEAHTIPATWHPINPADPTTLPGDGDANERGYIWYRFRNGAVRALTISRVLSMEKRLGDHWAPRFKQVPPVWEDAQQ